MDDLRSRLEQQSDELELLQSMFSAPGEFQIDDQTSYDQVSSFLRSLTPDAPGRLSCSLHIPIEAHHHHDAGEGTATRHTVDVFIRLPHRYLWIKSSHLISESTLWHSLASRPSTCPQDASRPGPHAVSHHALEKSKG